jgi:hypothetical protein
MRKRLAGGRVFGNDDAPGATSQRLPSARSMSTCTCASSKVSG